MIQIRLFLRIESEGKKIIPGVATLHVFADNYDGLFVAKVVNCSIEKSSFVTENI